jgi:hypothetical protein
VTQLSRVLPVFGSIAEAAAHLERSRKSLSTVPEASNRT